MTIPQVAVELGIKQEAGYHFVRKGILKANKMEASGNVKLITHEELLRFRAGYVLSRDLAESVGKPPHPMLSDCSQSAASSRCVGRTLMDAFNICISEASNSITCYFYCCEIYCV